MKPLRQIGQALDRMSTASKLGAAFAVMIMLTGALGAAGLWALERVNQDAQHLAQRWLPSLSHLEKARIAMLETRDFEVRHTRAEDEGYMDEYQEKTAAAMSRVTEALQSHHALLESDAERELRAGLDKAWAAYQGTHQKVLELGRKGQQDDARDISEGAGKSNMDDAILALDRLSAFTFEQARLDGENANAVYSSTLVALAAVLFSGLVLEWTALSFVLLGIAIWVAAFFRDPVRVTPIGENLIVSPADGLVVLRAFAPSRLYVALALMPPLCGSRYMCWLPFNWVGSS